LFLIRSKLSDSNFDDALRDRRRIREVYAWACFRRFCSELWCPGHQASSSWRACSGGRRLLKANQITRIASHTRRATQRASTPTANTTNAMMKRDGRALRGVSAPWLTLLIPLTVRPCRSVAPTRLSVHEVPRSSTAQADPQSRHEFPLELSDGNRRPDRSSGARGSTRELCHQAGAAAARRASSMPAASPGEREFAGAYEQRLLQQLHDGARFRLSDWSDEKPLSGGKSRPAASASL
jgi:hypothetical protein